MADTALSVVIPNWNGQRFLATCLDALLRQSYPHVEILLVDNASADESVPFVQAHYPQVQLIRLERNRGFAGACNAGIERARGEYVALLNNDTEVDTGWAAAIVSAFERHPQAGLIASKMLLFDQRDTFHTAGDGFRTDGTAYNRGVWQKDIGQYDREEYVFSACGGSAAYRRAMLRQIGLLDDDFFFSLEDVDLAWRAQLAGWRTLYTPYAIVYHHLSATGGGVTASYYDGRNGLYLLAKNLPAGLWRKYGGCIVRRQMCQAWEALRAWRGPAARARLRGLAAGLFTLPRMLHRRRAIQQQRTVSIEYLESILTPAC